MTSLFSPMIIFLAWACWSRAYDSNVVCLGDIIQRRIRSLSSRGLQGWFLQQFPNHFCYSNSKLCPSTDVIPQPIFLLFFLFFFLSASQGLALWLFVQCHESAPSRVIIQHYLEKHCVNNQGSRAKHINKANCSLNRYIAFAKRNTGYCFIYWAVVNLQKKIMLTN